MSKSFGKLMIVILVIPLVCGLLVVVVYDVIAGGVVSALPDWAQTPAVDWMMDIPQGSDYIPGGPVPGACDDGQGFKMGSTRIDWVDYSDPAAGDIHGVPLWPPVMIWSTSYDKPVLGCGFGRIPGYGMNGGIHNGADWPVNDGTQVHTILGGEVAWADFTAPGAGGQWGGLVIIENGAYQVWYAHMQEIFVTKGQIVQWGDVVGSSDNLGNSTGPHLHLGVKRKSDQCWINPVDFIDQDLYIVGGCG